ATRGATAARLAHTYGVGLTTIGLFVTIQFVAHMLMQVPGGRAADPFRARTSAPLGVGPRGGREEAAGGARPDCRRERHLALRPGAGARLSRPGRRRRRHGPRLRR